MSKEPSKRKAKKSDDPTPVEGEPPKKQKISEPPVPTEPTQELWVYYVEFQGPQSLKQPGAIVVAESHSHASELIRNRLDIKVDHSLFVFVEKYTKAAIMVGRRTKHILPQTVTTPLQYFYSDDHDMLECFKPLSLIVATNRGEAMELLDELLKKHRQRPSTVKPYHVIPIDNTRPQVIV